MANGLCAKVEEDLFHLYDFTIRKKRNENIFISMRNILSCEVHNSKMLPWQHHMQPLFKHLPLPDVAWFFSFSPQQLAFSSQQPSVCANGWSQWRLKILCYRLLSTLDTCQASKQINQKSIKWYRKRSTNYNRNRCS